MIALLLIAGLAADRDACLQQFAERAPRSAKTYFSLFDPLFISVGEKRGLDPALLKAHAWCETRFDPCAVSPVGARGLMQIVASVCLCQGESALGSSGRIVRPSCAASSLNESQKQGSVQRAKKAVNEVTS